MREKVHAEEYFLRQIGKTLEIDSKGRIWRIGSLTYGKFKRTERKRAEHRDTFGYLQLHTMNGERKQIVVGASRVVYAYFSGTIPPADLHIHHKDKNRENNRFENLQLLTAKEHINSPEHRRTYRNSRRNRRQRRFAFVGR